MLKKKGNYFLFLYFITFLKEKKEDIYRISDSHFIVKVHKSNIQQSQQKNI
jgi:hypothetical protein